MDTSVHIATVEASCDVPTTMEAAITVASRHQTIRPAQISIASIAAMHSRQPLGVKGGHAEQVAAAAGSPQKADAPAGGPGFCHGPFPDSCGAAKAQRESHQTQRFHTARVKSGETALIEGFDDDSKSTVRAAAGHACQSAGAITS
jgi:hypothetical protein